MPRLLLLPALVAAVALSLGAASASASTADDARAVAERFLTALAQNDPATACGLFTPKALEQLGGADRCRDALSESDDAADSAARRTLAHAFVAARRSAQKRRGLYVRKGFGVSRLARDMERIDPQLTVRVGASAKAAAGRLATTAILDSRSTGHRLVVYAESDDGSIWRLTAPSTGAASVAEVAQGIPETPKQPRAPDFSFTVDRVSVESDGSAYVTATLHPADPDESGSAAILLLLVPSERGFLVADLFASILSGGG